MTSPRPSKFASRASWPSGSSSGPTGIPRRLRWTRSSAPTWRSSTSNGFIPQTLSWRPAGISTATRWCRSSKRSSRTGRSRAPRRRPFQIGKFHQQWFHPANFIVAASGDFDRDQMVQKLEALFADWPFKGAAPPPIPTNTTFAAPGVYLVDKDVNQGRVAMMLPGILRDNPDYFAAVIMNDILGGGGFTSRIMNRVRCDHAVARR